MFASRSLVLLKRVLDAGCARGLPQSRGWTFLRLVSRRVLRSPPAANRSLADRPRRPGADPSRRRDRELWLVDGHGAPAWSLSVDEIAASSLEEALGRRGIARKTAKIGLEVDGSAFFVRRFDIPSVAAANLGRLLVADIERKTPFPSDCCTAMTVAPRAERATAPDKLASASGFLRRDIVSRAIENAGLQIEDLDFVQPAIERGRPDAAAVHRARRPHRNLASRPQRACGLRRAVTAVGDRGRRCCGARLRKRGAGHDPGDVGARGQACVRSPIAPRRKAACSPCCETRAATVRCSPICGRRWRASCRTAPS